MPEPPAQKIDPAKSCLWRESDVWILELAPQDAAPVRIELTWHDLRDLCEIITEGIFADAG